MTATRRLHGASTVPRQLRGRYTTVEQRIRDGYKAVSRRLHACYTMFILRTRNGYTIVTQYTANNRRLHNNCTTIHDDTRPLHDTRRRLHDEYTKVTRVVARRLHHGSTAVTRRLQDGYTTVTRMHASLGAATLRPSLTPSAASLASSTLALCRYTDGL